MKDDIIKLVDQDFYFVKHGKFSSDINDAKKMSFKEAEKYHMQLQLVGIKNCITSFEDNK